jgi:hypothetical protein
MTNSQEDPKKARTVIQQVSCWQKRLSGRLKKKLVSFDQRIATFRQRKWS